MRTMKREIKASAAAVVGGGASEYFNSLDADPVLESEEKELLPPPLEDRC